MRIHKILQALTKVIRFADSTETEIARRADELTDEPTHERETNELVRFCPSEKEEGRRPSSSRRRAQRGAEIDEEVNSLVLSYKKEQFLDVRLCKDYYKHAYGKHDNG